jgi:hypothetical protein
MLFASYSIAVFIAGKPYQVLVAFTKPNVNISFLSPKASRFK